ncbi:MAG: hypothetical protein KGY74_10770 [Candidatus Cloacimonetes bacterium]|nr:hypothetical protein [Candidatus Cloacimonadota bacterium]
MKNITAVLTGLTMLLLAIILVFVFACGLGTEPNNDSCFYSADSMVVQFETQRIRHLSDVNYTLRNEDMVIWSETQPEFAGRLDDLEIFHVYNQ